MTKRKVQLKSSTIHSSLLHHSHSGRLVHHHHTSYPLLAFLMLVLGILLIGVTFTVRAEVIHVTAAVLGQPPAYGATITEPKNGQVFNKTPIDVRGTCPPDSIVKIYRNDVFSGSDVCSPQGTFYVVSDLFFGKNTLIARVFNFADVEGPVSAPVVVYYELPSGQQPPAVQLYLQSDTKYQGLYPKEEIVWPLEIGGGVPPYAIYVDWGDGTNDVISRGESGTFDLHHIYQKPGGYKGTYTIKIKASDKDGNLAYLQLVVIVNDPKLATSLGGDDDGIGWLQSLRDIYRQIIFLWPFYIITLLMLVSFWLGEHYKFDRLFNSGRLRKR